MCLSMYNYLSILFIRFRTHGVLVSVFLCTAICVFFYKILYIWTFIPLSVITTLSVTIGVFLCTINCLFFIRFRTHGVPVSVFLCTTICVFFYKILYIWTFIPLSVISKSNELLQLRY